MNRHFFFGKYLARAVLGACVFSVLGGASIDSSAAGDASVGGLDQYAWHKRLLLVFAPDSHATSLIAQRTIIAGDHKAFAARDLVTIDIVGDQVSGAAVSASELRRHYGVPVDAFQVLLIGKDTGVKLRTYKPLAAAQLMKTIDAMPMRRDEVGSLRPLNTPASSPRMASDTSHSAPSHTSRSHSSRRAHLS